MRASISKTQNAFAFIVLVLLLLDWAGVDALQFNPPAIIGFSISPTRPHYATIRENGLLEITNYQTSTVIGSYFVPLPGQDITNLISIGYQVRDISYSPDGNLIAASIADISSRGMIYLVEGGA
jgi:hypothetical protein